MKPHRSFWELFGEIPQPGQVEASADQTPTGQRSPCACFFNEDFVYWAMRNLPITEAPKHFAILGAVGSGKTTAIDLFLQSIAPRFRSTRESPEQLIVFDAKCDILPTLAGLGLRPDDENVWILNPFDARSAVWNLASAARGRGMPRYIANMLVPSEPRSSSPFFASAAQDLTTYVIQALNRHWGARWSFRDLLCALESVKHIRAVTAGCPRIDRLAAAILDDDKHAFGVLSTLSTKISRFEEVAASWYHRPDARQFSVSEFLRRPGVLVLGHDPVLKESLAPINAILLKALSDEILHGPNTHRPRQWFVLDEFRAMDHVEAIHELLNRGRSKGASVLIGLQSIDGLIDVYGEHRAEDILSACAHKMFLRAGGPKTAEWAEKYFAKLRRTETVVTETYGGSGGPTTAYQHGLQDRPALLDGFFDSLPYTGPGKPYKAVCDVAWLNQVIIVERRFDELHRMRQPADANVLPFDPHADTVDQTIPSWTPEERELYAGKPAAEPQPQKEKKADKLPTRKRPRQGTQPNLPLEPPEF